MTTQSKTAVEVVATGGPLGADIRGLAPEIIARLYKENAAILQDRVSREKMDANDFEATVLNPEQFGAFIRREIEKWGKVVKATGARAE